MTDKTPAPITVGMPVYNGEKHLPATLESLLNQTFQDFELVISDNASRDATPDICADYARRDPRIRIIRQSENIGGSRNYGVVASNATGRYFKWNSSNDLCEARMLEVCKQALDTHPECVLAYPEARLIDEEGMVVGNYDDPLDATSDSPAERFRRVFSTLALNNAVNGLIRADALARTGLHRNYPSGDLPLMVELALLGKFIRLPDRLFLRRISPESMTTGRDAAAMREFNRLNHDGLFVSNSLKIWLEYVQAVRRSDLNFSRRRQLYPYLLRMLYWRLPTITRESAAEFREWLGRRFLVSGR